MSAQDPGERRPDGRSFDREEADTALRDSEERYRALFDRSLDCIYVHDFEGRFLDANRAALELLGYGHEEILSLTFSSLLDDDQLGKALGTLAELKEAETQRTSTEYRLRRKTGEYVDVEIRASVILRDGVPYAVQGIARDITERRRAEQALIEREEQFQMIFKAAPGSMILSSLPDGETIDVNDNFSSITGYSREEALGKTTGDLGMWADPGARDRFLSVLQSDGMVKDFEADLNHKSGAIRNGLERCST